MSTGTCEQLYVRNIFFKEKLQILKITKIIKMILNHLYFGPSLLLGRTAFRCFSKCFFFIFCRLSTMVADILTHPPTPKSHQQLKCYSQSKFTSYIMASMSSTDLRLKKLCFDVLQLGQLFIFL